MLLPAKQVPQDVQVNDSLTVFVYRDSRDRLIATTKEPVMEVGEIALLTVKQVGQFGAFLDWGLEKDLLDSTLRFSLSVFTTEEEIDDTLQTLYDIVPALRKYTRH